MNQQKTLHHTLVLAAAAVILCISVFIALQAYVGLKSQELTNNAVDECGNLAKSVVKDQFIRPIYKACLEDKGYSTSLTE